MPSNGNPVSITAYIQLAGPMCTVHYWTRTYPKRFELLSEIPTTTSTDHANESFNRAVMRKKDQITGVRYSDLRCCLHQRIHHQTYARGGRKKTRENPESVSAKHAGFARRKNQSKDRAVSYEMIKVEHRGRAWTLRWKQFIASTTTSSPPSAPVPAHLGERDDQRDC